jgi:carbon monoxide dehydrogenase subunit G
MEITGEYRIPATREAVWKGLNDPEILRQSIPGCEILDKVSDFQFSGTVTAKVGPVKAKFRGGVTLSDLNPPKGYVLSGEGKGAAAGFAKGSAKVDLEEDGDATILQYSVDAQVGGKLAQVGSRLIEGTVKKLSAEFFQNFSNILASQCDPVDGPAPNSTSSGSSEEAVSFAPQLTEMQTPRDTSGSIPLAIWAVGVIVIVSVILWIFAGN